MAGKAMRALILCMAKSAELRCVTWRVSSFLLALCSATMHTATRRRLCRAHAAAPSSETHRSGSCLPAGSSAFASTRSTSWIDIRASLFSSWSSVTAPSALRR
eukprot:3404578-Pyramimonas_sp.AAC.1